jgi:FAD/FMN-containing dehydrogenase
LPGNGPQPPDRFVAEARALVGEQHVLTDTDATATYTVDWTRRWSGSTRAVVRPGSTAELAELVRLARTHRVALVPQGGNTGLVGGSVPHRGEAVVSLRRLAGIEPVDTLAGQVTVDAGVTLSRLQQHAASAGLAFGVDLGARDSATVGGMIATNAGGLHVVRYGAMRAQVLGVEAVLGSGAIVSRLGGLVKDNTGYDLAQMLCGSEGTLGLVTRARLKLIPAPRHVVVALLAMPSLAAAVERAADLRWRLPGVQALEVMAGDSLRRVADHLGSALPMAPNGADAFLLVEVEGAEDPTEALAAALDRAGGASAGEALDAAVATSSTEAARLWRFREAHSETAAAVAAARGGVVHKLDVTLPTSELAAFCHDVVALVETRWPGSVTFIYGHVGDGNVHVNVVEPEATGPRAPCRGPAGLPGSGGTDSAIDNAIDNAIDDAVLGLVVERGGSISAEHGIGVAKKRWLERNRSVSEVEAMRAVKAALDPDGILNPNVLLP